jgi:hypothetical protein
MTNIVRKDAKCTSRAQVDGTLYSLKTEAEVEKLDREMDHDYVPMDVFIDPKTVKEHFQDPPIRARLKEIHSAAA